MTREEAKYVLEPLTGTAWLHKAVCETVDEIYDDFEEKLAKEKDLHSLTRNRFKEAEIYIEKLKKDRDYWKLSFNKQVEAGR